jgi:GNAT superfamily N-acetyltransferase
MPGVAASRRHAGVASRLLGAAEEAARASGLSLLHLQTHQGLAAGRLYRRLGWNVLGVVPGYARAPDGRLVANIFFWKALDPGRQARP